MEDKSKYTSKLLLRESVLVYSENSSETIASKPPETLAVPTEAPAEEVEI
jgi:hypothetical protein